jgi:hypothetical protein
MTEVSSTILFVLAAMNARSSTGSSAGGNSRGILPPPAAAAAYEREEAAAEDGGWLMGHCNRSTTHSDSMQGSPSARRAKSATLSSAALLAPSAGGR